MVEKLISGETVVLPDPPPGWFELDYSLTPAGELAMVRCDRDHVAEFRAWYEEAVARATERLERGETPPPRPTLSGARLRLSRFDGKAESEAFEVASDSWYKVAALPGGDWLVSSGARFQRYTGGGTATDSVDLGDYIEHVACTRSGKIWVGYIDQGVFAGLNPDGSAPHSTAGIASFSPDGTLLWRFNWREELSVFDCYSLTIDGERVWSCSYSDPSFSIVLIENGEVKLWGNDLIGVKALAVAGDYVLLAGGYEADSNRVALLKLGPADAQLIKEWRFEPPRQHSAQLMQGLGSTLHLVRNRKWSRITVQMLLDAARPAS
ncbi:MAG: hypothetical protein IT535_03980 [Bauldia sp.]|nr:hypothetical protein [Bauldia sp.]